MARFKLREGERVISLHRASIVDGRSARPANIYLTTDRVVVTVGPKSSPWGFLGGPLLFAMRVLSMDRNAEMLHQIRRDDFDVVEAGEGDMAIFRNKGEGYAHVSFAITCELMGTDSVQTWQQRMHAWASRTEEAAPLPTATLVDKS